MAVEQYSSGCSMRYDPRATKRETVLGDIVNLLATLDLTPNARCLLLRSYAMHRIPTCAGALGGNVDETFTPERVKAVIKALC
jgi:hypothetical protein